MKRLLSLLIVAFALGCGSAWADPASFDGVWTAKVPSPNAQATIEVTFTFKVNGEKLSGTASAGGQEYPLVDTRVAGNEIAFAVEGEPARYAGTLAGDEIKMKVTFKSSENGTRTWSFVAKRATTRQSPAGQAAIAEPSIDHAFPNFAAFHRI